MARGEKVLLSLFHKNIFSHSSKPIANIILITECLVIKMVSFKPEVFTAFIPGLTPESPLIRNFLRNGRVRG